MNVICTPDLEISSKEYVRVVYSDAIGYLDGYKAATKQPSLSVYEFIDQVSRVTGDRLRGIGAHADSSWWNKTSYLIAFKVLWTDTVECSWVQDWKDALDAKKQFLSSYKAPAQVAFDATMPVFKDVIKFGLDISLPAILLAYLVLDAYGETKREVKNRLA